MSKETINMKKLSVSLLTAFVLSSMTITYAAPSANQGNYKGEVPCPPQLILKDGLYFGVQAGYDAYRVINDLSFLSTDPGLIFAFDPRLSVTGPVGGAFLGFGHYFSSFYNTYLAFEMFGNASAAETDSQVLSQSLLSSAFVKYSTDMQVSSNYGLSLLPGIKLNNATLFYIRLGYNWTNIDVNDYIIVNTAVVANSIYDVTSSGFNYGLGLETAVVPNVSVRAEYTHTDYSNFTTYVGTKVNPQDNQYMLGFILHLG